LKKENTVDDLSRKIDLLERRITLLERAIARSAANPGIVYFSEHKLERDNSGDKFVWLGCKGSIQLVLPPAPVGKAICHLLLAPHPAVKLEKMAVYVNDRARDYKFERGVFARPSLSFEIEEAGAASINIVIAGVDSICPADLGENDDTRSLAFMFCGCKIIPQFSAEERAVYA
jgi:hypothetical protein